MGVFGSRIVFLCYVPPKIDFKVHDPFDSHLKYTIALHFSPLLGRGLLKISAVAICKDVLHGKLRML